MKTKQALYITVGIAARVRQTALACWSAETKWTTICQGLGSPVASAASSRLLGRRQDVLKANACSSWTSDPTEPAKVSHPPIARPRLLVQFAYESAMPMASRVISSCLRTEGGHRTQHSIRFPIHNGFEFASFQWFVGSVRFLIMAAVISLLALL